MFTYFLNPQVTVDLANCPESLNHYFFNDGFCDDTNNIPECGYDGGDCCHPEGYCYDCEWGGCICHYTEKRQCQLITGI